MPDHDHAWARKAAEEIASEFFPLLRKTYCSNECECEKCDSITSCRVAEQNTTETIFAIILRHAREEFDGVARIAAERRRQIKEEGFDTAHDTANADGELAWAACYYAMPGKMTTSTGHTITYGDLYPYPAWKEDWAKRDQKDRIRQLVVAGALIAAEIDRLQTREDTP